MVSLEYTANVQFFRAPENTMAESLSAVILREMFLLELF